MISWIKIWAEGIIIAIIIATIIEMIIPEGTIKRYVKIVIGVYIMFNIISPVINKLTSKEVHFSIDNYEKYYKQTDVYRELNKELVSTNENQITEVYKDKLKDDIIKKMEQKGYSVNNIILDINTKNDKDDYGKINRLEINIIDNADGKKVEDDRNIVERVSVSKINIESNKANNKTNTNEIKNSNELKEYLSEEYGVDKNNISINNK